MKALKRVYRKTPSFVLIYTHSKVHRLKPPDLMYNCAFHQFPISPKKEILFFMSPSVGLYIIRSMHSFDITLS